MLSIFQKFLVKSDLRRSTQAHNFEGLPSQANMQWGGGGTASQLPLTGYGSDKICITDFLCALNSPTTLTIMK